MALKKTLTIAGSDTSAGAGMQADLKTFQELGTYGIVALTSIVTMDKESWSHDVTPIPFDVFEKQLETARNYQTCRRSICWIWCELLCSRSSYGMQRRK